MFIVFLILWYISIRSIWVPGRPNLTVLKTAVFIKMNFYGTQKCMPVIAKCIALYIQ
jgi:hypothetical protein